MKVSVAVVTYNHEEFIAKAIDSILMQRTDFEYEIVIGEDCSTDTTRRIIEEYAAREPDKFKLFLNEKNLGPFRNVQQVFAACRGEYLALLEGDDCWTSPDKLQKQVDFLDSHPECTVCFHDVIEVYQDGSREPHHFVPNYHREFYSVEDLLEGNFIPTPSTMLRNGVVPGIPAWFEGLPMGDWPYLILHAVHGKIGYLDEAMAIHMNHRGGAWYHMNRSWVAAHQASIMVYDRLYRHLDARYRPAIARILYGLCLLLAKEFEADGNLAEARKFALLAFTKHFFLTRELAEMLLRLYVPLAYRAVKAMGKPS